VRCVVLDELEPNLRCDTIYNLASYGVSPGERDPDLMLQGNVELVGTLLRVASAWAPTRFIHTGSCAEYAPVEQPILLEEESALDPPTLYGAAKAASAVFGRALARQLGVSWVCLRLFGTYGPGEATHRLIPSLVARLVDGHAAAMSQGLQVRDMCYIDDVIDAFILASDPEQRFALPCYNVCSGTPVAIVEVARSVAKTLGVPESRLGLGELSMREGEQMWLVGSSQRFREATGWLPTVGLDEGVRRSVESCRAQLLDEAAT